MKRAVSFERPKAPWLEWKGSFKKNINEAVSQELDYLEKWLKPTEFEEKTRLLTITKLANIIETNFPPAIVITQGSSATETYLPSSDIDLIVTNLSKRDSADSTRTLMAITKLFWKHKVIVNGYIIPGARVPLIKAVDRCFGYNIDICISNINGVLNVPRVRSILQHNPKVRTILMFMKLFVYLHDIDNPATGGFGSNHLLNIVLFAFQAFKASHEGRDPENEGEVLLFLMNLIANNFNFFLCGASTVGDGYLFSKRKEDQFEYQCPLAFVFEDPQFHGVYFGNRTRKTINLRNEMKIALAKIEKYVSDGFPLGSSPLGCFLPSTDEIVKRRDRIKRNCELLSIPPDEFAATMNMYSGKTWETKEKKPIPIFRNGIIRVSPDPEPMRRSQSIPRSLSSPDGFGRSPFKNVWDKQSKKDDIKGRKNGFGQMTKSWSTNRFKKYK